MHKSILVFFYLQIILVCSVKGQKYRHKVNQSYEFGFIVATTSNEDLLPQFAPSIGLNLNNWHIDAALNTLEPYSLKRMPKLVCESEYKKTQFAIINIGYNLAISQNYYHDIFIISKIGLFYSCDIFVSEFQDIYTIVNEKYRPNFDIDASFYLRRLNGIGLTINIASTNYDFGFRVSKYF